MRSYANLSRARRHGSDSFGRFRVTGGPCTHCGQENNLCVSYQPTNGQYVDLPHGIKPSDTILQPHGTQVSDTFLGINCGCYAKLHRQVTHISEKIEARK